MEAVRVGHAPCFQLYKKYILEVIYYIYSGVVVTTGYLKNVQYGKLFCDNIAKKGQSEPMMIYLLIIYWYDDTY